MGQKVHPFAYRLGYIYHWPSKWFSRKDYRSYLREDFKIRRCIEAATVGAGVVKIEIERSNAGATVSIFTAKPGVVIGRGGAQIEELKRAIKKLFPKAGTLNVNIQEIEKPILYAAVTSESVKMDLEKRIPFRTALRQALERIKKGGARGAKIMVAGRLNGAEIARTESVAFGSIPLQNLRADVDYGLSEAHTIYGKIGIKVWIYRGEIFKK